MDRAPDALRKELELPFSERVIAPMGERLVGLDRKLTRADAAESLQHKLDIAGNPPGWDVNRILGLKVLGAILFGALTAAYLVLRQTSPLVAVLVVVAMTVFGFLLPNILLHNTGQKRNEQMQNALPENFRPSATRSFLPLFPASMPRLLTAESITLNWRSVSNSSLPVTNV